MKSTFNSKAILISSSEDELCQYIQGSMKIQNHDNSQQNRPYKPYKTNFYSYRKENLTDKLQAVKYEDVCCFKQFKQTTNLETHFYSFKQFLQNSQKNILFIFGPSGCGKTLFTISNLSKNNIEYQFAQGKIIQSEDSQLIYEDNIDLITKLLKSRTKFRGKTYIISEFPIMNRQMGSIPLQKYRQFKEQIYDLIKQSHNLNKYIFILNSEIFSSYFILNQNSETKAISRLPNVCIIRMEGYGNREMKQIINHFIKIFPEYTNIVNNSKDIDEIVLEASGDARKALNIIYSKKIKELSKQLPEQESSSSSITFYDEQTKAKIKKSIKYKSFNTYLNAKPQHCQEKVSLFHMIGKFLYGKRLNSNYDYSKKKSKNNQISCYYTEQQLKRVNPKFYFDPVEMFQKSHIHLSKFIDLLQQNFIHRYGKISDIKDMYKIFRYQDSFLADNLSKHETKIQMQSEIKILLTWGIIIYNRNSVRDSKGLFKITRSKNNVYQKLVAKKIEIIRASFLKNKLNTHLSFQSKLTDLLFFGRLLQNCYIVPKNNLYLLIFLELLFDNKKRNLMYNSQLDGKTNIIQQQQEDSINEQCNRLNQISEKINRELSKKRNLYEIIMDNSDESDIDSD